MIIRRYGVTIMLSFMILFLLSAFFLLSFINGRFNAEFFMQGGFFALYIVLQYNILRKVFRHLDRYTLLITDFLMIIGVTMLYRMDPDTGKNSSSGFWRERR